MHDFFVKKLQNAGYHVYTYKDKSYGRKEKYFSIYVSKDSWNRTYKSAITAYYKLCT